MLRTRSPTHCWLTFSLTYGDNLPSSLSSFHSNTLGFSPCPPELVCGTVNIVSTFSGFSCKHGITVLWPKPPHHVSTLVTRICQSNQPTRLNLNPITGTAILLHPRITPLSRYRNINLFPIDYAFQPRLRGRLTLGRLS